MPDEHWVSEKELAAALNECGLTRSKTYAINSALFGVRFDEAEPGYTIKRKCFDKYLFDREAVLPH
jgi:hypothetical protein